MGDDDLFSDDEFDFDPFQVGNVQPASTPTKSKTQRSPLRTKDDNSTKSSKSKKSTPEKHNGAIPPRLDVRFQLHEEVSSFASTSMNEEGASDVVVEGKVLAQLASSDALRSIPFTLIGKDVSGVAVDFIPNNGHAKVYKSKDQTKKVTVIKIPKNTVGFVNVGKYKVKETINHFPLLLERRVTLMDENKKIQIALQVRSKLTNKDDLSDLSIAVSIPDIVVSGSVAVTTGEGRYDVMKRTMVWKLDELPKGESFMVTAEAELNQPMDKQLLQDLSFPALLRCHSKDKISNAKFYASDAVGYPSTVTASVVASSYRILHRLK